MFIDLTLVSVSLRDTSMEIREIGVDCVGAINGSWFWVTLVFKGKGKKTNIFHRYQWAQDNKLTSITCTGDMLIYCYQFLTVLYAVVKVVMCSRGGSASEA